MSPAHLRLLLRMAWRHAWRRPLQSAFLVAGVAIGVAMVVAIDLANGSATRAFQLSTETLAGRATHRIVGGPTGLDEALYTRLRRELGYRLSAPVVEGYVVVQEMDGRPMRLLGVDPFADAPFRSYLGADGPAQGATDLAPLLVEPNAILLSTALARRYGLALGDVVRARGPGPEIPLRIVGLLEPVDRLSRRALDGLLLADIATAQEVLGRVGRLDRIDLMVPEGPPGEAVLERIQALLPVNARMEPAGARTGTVAEMTAAFQLNLTALSLLALVVGMFLIYNTVTFSVVQRRPVLGTLRALGMTRTEIFRLILLESGLLGLLGTLLGLGLGILLGRSAVQAVTTTINDLFFVVAVREMDVPPATLVKGAVAGIGAGLLAALVPAWEATQTPPAGVMQRSRVEERARALVPRVAGAGGGLVLVGLALMLPEWPVAVAFAGLFGILLGAALMTPGITGLLMGGLARALGPGGHILVRMAPRDLIRSLSRTSVAIAALMVAVSVIIGVSVMIGSFRQTVEEWLDEVLQADVFITAPRIGSSRLTGGLSPELAQELARFPGVAQVATNREVEVVARLGNSGKGPREITVRVSALSQDLAGPDRRFRETQRDPAAVWPAVEAGGVVVNDPLANRYRVRVGDVVELFTDRGWVGFPVVAVAYDFDIQPGLLMADPVYRRYWDDPAVSAIAVQAAPGVEVDRLVEGLRQAFAGRATLLIRSNRATREEALEVFDRTFAITVALRLLATLVAFIGILSTLMSLQMERTREIGVLRATGMTRPQLWLSTLLETGLMGLTAGLLALPVGFVLALVLIYIINLRSFGWTLSMRLLPEEFLQAFLVAVTAALVAGLLPAWHQGRVEPGDALRGE